MTGYQEVLTDPVLRRADRHDDVPGDRQLRRVARGRRVRAPKVAGFIVRDESPVASNWRADGTLRDYLIRHNIVAISDIDTRALTRVLRSAGVMRGVIATGDADPRVLVEKARAVPPMEGADLVRGVTCETRIRLDAGRLRTSSRRSRRAAAEAARCASPRTTSG